MNSREGELKLILLRVGNRNIIEPTQQVVPWNQNRTSKFLILFTSSEIVLKVNGSDQNKVSVKRFLESPAYLVIGDQDNTLGTSVKSFVSLSCAPHSTLEEDMVCMLIDLNDKKNECKGVRKKIQPSFVEIFKALGDLDIFLLIVSHAFKRMKTNPELTEMIRFSLHLMEGFVRVKHVEQKPLKKAER